MPTRKDGPFKYQRGSNKSKNNVSPDPLKIVEPHITCLPHVRRISKLGWKKSKLSERYLRKEELINRLNAVRLEDFSPEPRNKTN